jgi:alpha-N-arabinofuranosidase
MKKIETHRLSKYLHGTFAEYFGSTVYDGIWVGKDSDIPNVNGIRRDVIEGIRECGLSVFRWPGGCCAEKYHWMDGIGENRLPRMHYAEDTTKWNWDMSFGTDEFMELCRLCDIEPMLVANVSTGTAEEFRAWYEYCNAPAYTKYGAMRAANGHPEPYNVTLWGIGNTDENSWKLAYNPYIYAADYLRFTAALDCFWMKKITTVGLGLSIRHGHNDWPAGVMDLVTNNGEIKGPDMLSIHHYLGSMKDEKCGDAVDYTDEEYYYLLDSLEQYRLDIDFHRRLIEEHACKKYPTYIAMDEWGTWHAEATIESGQRERQTMRDAIFAAMAMHIFYRNADVVKMAMQTQLTNLIQSLFETDGASFMRTATFWVMKLFREHKEQYLLADAFACGAEVDAVASISEDGGKVVLTAANKDLYRESAITVCEEIASMRIAAADVIYSEDVRAYNTYEDPDRITAKPFDAALPAILLPPHSVIRIVFEK